MIVHNFHIARSGPAIWPTKAYSPLIIDPNAPLAFAVSAEFLQPVSTQRSQFTKAYGRFQPKQPVFRLMPKGLERLDPFATREPFRPRVAVTEDHAIT